MEDDTSGNATEESSFSSENSSSSSTSSDETVATPTEPISEESVTSPIIEDKRSKREYSLTGLSFDLGVGTYGIETSFTGSLHNLLRIPFPIHGRLGFAIVPYTKEISGKEKMGGMTLNVRGKPLVSNMNLLFDFLVAKQYLKITTGMTVNFHKAEMSLAHVGNKNLNDVTFTSEEIGTLEGTIKFAPVGWYIGLGHGSALANKRVAFLADVGVTYLGKPRVEMSGTGMIGPSSANAEKIEKVLGKSDYALLRWYPKLSFMLGIKIL